LYARAKIVPSKQNARAKTPSKQAEKKNPFQRAKTPSKQAEKKKPFQRAKTPSKQIVKKKPFERAKTPSKQTEKKKPFERAKKPSKQIVKKKPFERAKKPSKQIVKKKPFQKAKASSNEVVKRKRKRRARTPALVESLFGQIIVIGATVTVTLTAALVLGYSSINPSSSIGKISGKAAPDTTKVKKNVIGKRKPTKSPLGYDLDVGTLPEKTAVKDTKEEPVEEKKPEATSPVAASESK